MAPLAWIAKKLSTSAGSSGLAADAFATVCAAPNSGSSDSHEKQTTSAPPAFSRSRLEIDVSVFMRTSYCSVAGAPHPAPRRSLAGTPSPRAARGSLRLRRAQDGADDACVGSTAAQVAV